MQWLLKFRWLSPLLIRWHERLRHPLHQRHMKTRRWRERAQESGLPVQTVSTVMVIANPAAIDQVRRVVVWSRLLAITFPLCLDNSLVSTPAFRMACHSRQKCCNSCEGNISVSTNCTKPTEGWSSSSDSLDHGPFPSMCEISSSSVLSDAFRVMSCQGTVLGLDVWSLYS
jgi:hypothetical protein